MSADPAECDGGAEKDGRIDPKALKLFGALVARNVEDAAFTTNRLMEGYRAQIADLERALVGLYDAVSSDPNISLRTFRKIEPYEWLVSSIEERRGT